jgi:NAD(P)-dependent dehydrogenase (short-subunit alcohol dehydrogenase family)
MQPFTDSLKGKFAVVTGGGSGIGKDTAFLLAASGARIALIGRTSDELHATHRKLSGRTEDHLAILADVSVEQEMKRAFDEIERHFGRLDIVVSNAGINGTWAPLSKLSVEDWDSTFAINLRGTFLTVKLALPLLLASEQASVVIVSSINGTRIFSNSGATAYACSKAAQVAFTKMTALELAKDGIRVNVVCPGSIETNIEDSTHRKDLANLHLPVEFPEGEIPLTDGEPGSSEQVARLIWFLSSELSNHITGTEIYIEGGQSLLQG